MSLNWMDRLRAVRDDYVLALGPNRLRPALVMVQMLALTGLELLALSLLAAFVSVVLGNPVALPAELATLEWSSDAGRNALVWFSAVLVVVFIVKGFVTYRMQRAIARFSEDRRGELLISLAQSYMAQPYAFHLAHSSSDLFNRAYLSATNYSAGILTASMRALSDLIILAAIVVLLLWRDPSAVLTLSVLLVALFLVVHGPLRRQHARALAQYVDANGKLWAAMFNALHGVKELKLLGREFYFLDLMRKQTPKVADGIARTQVYAFVPRVVIEAVLVTFLVGYCWVMLRLHGADGLIASLGLFAVASVRMMPAASSLMNGLNTMRAYRPQLTTLCAQLRSHAMAQDFGPPPAPRDDFQSLRFDLVSFRYLSAGPDVLKDVSLTLRCGESLGVMGKSGAGKSTLADLMLGLFSPSAGQILINEQPMGEQMRAWQQQVAYIPQSVFLMDDSVARNVALGVPDAEIDVERVWSALEQSQLADVIRALPGGLQSSLGERAVRLSGGQRQRLAIARAIYHGREVLILDEATSALDEETERAVVESIGALAGKKTLVVIAHKASTIRYVQSVITVEEGSIRAGYPSYLQEPSSRDQS